jgi:dCTP deaminase
MLLSDYQIKNLCETDPPLISPYVPELIREIDGRGVISYGPSSYGYDLTLSSAGLKIFRHLPGTIVNPKAFNEEFLVNADVFENEYGRYSVIPHNSYALGFTDQRFVMPSEVTGICVGKSTYARVGLSVNTTPLEAGWEGHLTLELSNNSKADLMVYLDEGIAQVMFHQGAPCMVTYADRRGKYQGQGREVVTARV